MYLYRVTRLTLLVVFRSRDVHDVTPDSRQVPNISTASLCLFVYYGHAVARVCSYVLLAKLWRSYLLSIGVPSPYSD